MLTNFSPRWTWTTVTTFASFWFLWEVPTEWCVTQRCKKTIILSCSCNGVELWFFASDHCTYHQNMFPIRSQVKFERDCWLTVVVFYVAFSIWWFLDTFGTGVACIGWSGWALGWAVGFWQCKTLCYKGLNFLFRHGQLYRELRDPVVHEVLFRCKSNPLSAVLCKRLCPGMPIEFQVHNNIFGLIDQ